MIIRDILNRDGRNVSYLGNRPSEKNEMLTVTGPYAYVKNPLYVGSILITVGFCILANNIYILALAALMFCFHYIPYKKKVEGERLKKIFGRELKTTTSTFGIICPGSPLTPTAGRPGSSGRSGKTARLESLS